MSPCLTIPFDLYTAPPQRRPAFGPSRHFPGNCRPTFQLTVGGGRNESQGHTPPIYSRNPLSSERRCDPPLLPPLSFTAISAASTHVTLCSTNLVGQASTQCASAQCKQHAPRPKAQRPGHGTPRAPHCDLHAARPCFPPPRCRASSLCPRPRVYTRLHFAAPPRSSSRRAVLGPDRPKATRNTSATAHRRVTLLWARGTVRRGMILAVPQPHCSPGC